MSELDDLYQEVILDHYKRPRNWGRLAAPDREVVGHNPLCGDRITIQVQLDGDVIKDLRVEGSGCAISTASASLMTEAVKGKSMAEAEKLFAGFHDLVTGKGDPAGAALGKLAAFGGISEYPARVKCAALAWHALHSALQGKSETISTEDDHG